MQSNLMARLVTIGLLAIMLVVSACKPKEPVNPVPNPTRCPACGALMPLFCGNSVRRSLAKPSAVNIGNRPERDNGVFDVRRGQNAVLL